MLLITVMGVLGKDAQKPVSAIPLMVAIAMVSRLGLKVSTGVIQQRTHLGQHV